MRSEYLFNKQWIGGQETGFFLKNRVSLLELKIQPNSLKHHTSKDRQRIKQIEQIFSERNIIVSGQIRYIR